MTTKSKKSEKAITPAVDPKPEITPEVSKPSTSFQGPGVIVSIVEMIEKADPKVGISKEEILAELVKKFPERDKVKMSKTVAVQVPARISSERFKVKKLESGGYCKA